MKICNSCGNENGDNAKFCVECGEKLQESPKFCPECGTELVNQPKFCPECGTKVKINSNFDVKKLSVSPMNAAQENRIGNKIEIGDYIYINNEIEVFDLSDAVKHGHIDFIKSSRDKISELSVYDLSCVHNVETVKLLLSYGCNFNAMDEKGDTVLNSILRNYCVSLSDYRNHYETNGDETFEDDWTGDKYNCENDVHNKYLGLFDILIKNGVNPNLSSADSNYSTLLIEAVNLGLTKLVYLLVENFNVDVNYVPKKNNESMGSGDSALMAAIISSDVDVQQRFELVKFLIAKGANVNYKFFYYDELINKQRVCTPLTYAFGNIEIINLLIDKGADYKEFDIDEDLLYELFDYISNDDELDSELISLFNITNVEDRYQEYWNEF